jgi:hypothetical protein
MWYDEKERWDAVFERVRAFDRAELQRQRREAAEQRRRKAEQELHRTQRESDESHGFWHRIKHVLH